MVCVLNKHHGDIPSSAIYIGRGSPWGNPFVIGKHGNRAEVIMQHAEWLFEQHDLLARIPMLAGHDLVCFCNPLPCHGDLLLWLANMSEIERTKIYSEFVR